MADNKFLAEIVNQAIAKGNKILENSFVINEDSREHLQHVMEILNNISLKKNYSEMGAVIFKLSDGINKLLLQPYDPTHQTGEKIVDYFLKQNP
jgi:hypothetical protein